MYDYHRHLGGSISINTVCKLLNNQYTVNEIRNHMVLKKPVLFNRFLDSFKYLNEIDWTIKKLEIAIDDVVSSVENDNNLNGAYIIFSIDKYNIDPETIFKTFYNRTLTSSKDIKLIYAIKYENSAEGFIKFIKFTDITKYIYGINFISKEHKMDRKYVTHLIKLAKYYRLYTSMHVGENGGDDNIKFAINNGVDTICHGTKASHETVLNIINNKINVDVSFVSNILTSIITTPEQHAFYKYINHDNIRLISDDPVIFNNSIQNEMALLPHYEVKS